MYRPRESNNIQRDKENKIHNYSLEILVLNVDQKNNNKIKNKLFK